MCVFKTNSQTRVATPGYAPSFPVTFHHRHFLSSTLRSRLNFCFLNCSFCTISSHAISKFFRRVLHVLSSLPISAPIMTLPSHFWRFSISHCFLYLPCVVFGISCSESHEEIVSPRLTLFLSSCSAICVQSCSWERQISFSNSVSSLPIVPLHHRWHPLNKPPFKVHKDYAQ